MKLTFFRNVRLLFTLDLRRLLRRIMTIEQSLNGVSLLTLGAYATDAALMQPREERAELNSHEFKAYSQGGEDGILLWIFSKIGTGSRTYVEFGIGSGRECITANLTLNFNWHGLMMDGSKDNIRDAREFFKYLMRWQDFEQLEIKRQFITKENIDGIIAKRRHPENPDLLVIDIDGNDYWVWEAITSITSRIVVIEYNATFGPERRITTPYKPDFDTYSEHGLGLYHGASLAALVALGMRKGYVFVGCDSRGANAFFVQKEFAHNFKHVTAAEAFYDNAQKLKRGSRATQFAHIKDLPLIEV